MISGSTIMPTLQYDDALKAMEWLISTFGFEKRMVHEEAGIIHHAQLVKDNGMVMISSTNKTSDYGKLIKQPKEIDGLETQSPYVIIQDVEDVYHKAVANGAEIVLELKTEAYGGQSFSCRDIEGHLWNFGSYNPWNIESNEEAK